MKPHGAFSSGRRRGSDNAFVPLDADPGPEQLIVIGKDILGQSFKGNSKINADILSFSMKSNELRNM